MFRWKYDLCGKKARIPAEKNNDQEGPPHIEISSVKISTAPTAPMPPTPDD